MFESLQQRKLRERTRQVARLLGGVFLFSALINVMMLALPIYITQIYSRVLPSQSLSTLITISLVIVGTLGAASVLELIRAVLVERAAANFESALGIRLVQGAILHPNLYGGNAQALRDLATIRYFVGGRPCVALLDIPFFPLFVLILFLVHWLLGLVALIAAMLVIALWVLSELATAHLQQRASEVGAAAMSKAETYAQNGAPIRAMGMLGHALSDWRLQYNQMLRLNDQASTRSAWFLAASRFVRNSLQVIVLAVGAWLVIQEQLSPGLLLAASVLGARALAPLEMAISAWRPLMQARFAYRRVRQVLADTVIPETQSSFRISEGRVDLDNVLYFDRMMSPEPVIKGISFSVAPGEVLGVMGLTGSGKSTLGRLIAGAIDPTAGAVRIDGVDLRGSDRIMLGRDIGYYGQNLELFAGTVSENISRFASNSDPELLKEAVRAANAEGILSALPKGPETEVRPGRRLLSPGQQQSVLLARAFYGSPKLLVLDSPTSDLDPHCEQAVVNAVAAAKQRGTTIVIIAPARGFLQLLDRVLVMNAGRVEKIEARNEVVRPTVPPIQMAEQVVRYRAVAR